MTAQDNLNHAQFISTAKVGAMTSIDWGGTVEEAYQRQLGAKARGLGDWPVQQQELHEKIKANGIETPIEIGKGTPGWVLLNGHHRYYEARRQDIPEMPYTDRS